MDVRVTDMSEYRLRRLLLEQGTLREYPERFELCVVKDYESLYPEFSLHSIGIGGIFLQVLERNGKYRIVSYEFSKESFCVQDIAQWMDTYHVKLYTNIDGNRVCVYSAKEIIEGLKLKGNVIVLYTPGNGEHILDIDDLPEVTEKFIPSLQKRDTSYCKEIDSVERSMRIILNGEQMDHIPRIELDLSKDMLICNGNVILADYVDDFSGCIGFYSKEKEWWPIAWIHDTATTVFIDIFEGKSAKIVIIQCKYIVDLEALFDLLD